MMITLILEWSVAVTKSDLDQFPKFYEPSSNPRNGNKTLPISLLANFILSPKRIKLDHSHFSALIISLPHWRQKDISWQRVHILFNFVLFSNENQCVWFYALFVAFDFTNWDKMEKLHGIGNKTNPITWKQVASQSVLKPEFINRMK